MKNHHKKSRNSKTPKLTVINGSNPPVENDPVMSKNSGMPENELKERLSKKLDNTRASLKELFKTLDEVNNMVGVIREVAGKTDLLALNASIEAARAGHAGKGFAIVADEVGRLSEKVQQAVSAVEVSCHTLRDNISTVAEGIEDTAKTVGNGKSSIAA